MVDLSALDSIHEDYSVFLSQKRGWECWEEIVGDYEEGTRIWSLFWCEREEDRREAIEYWLIACNK